MKTKHPSARVTGFTLVELLAVIAIIAVLAVIALVVSNVVRESARGTQNLANHRTIVTALLQSAYDNKGVLPYHDHGSSIKTSFPRYLTERGYITDYRVFFSPKAGTWYLNNLPALRRPDIPTVEPWYYTNYGANRAGAMPHALDDGNRKPAVLTRIDQPAQLMLLRDTYRPGYDTEDQNYGGGVSFFTSVTNYLPPEEKSFGGKVHASFADGSVKVFTLDEMRAMADRPVTGAPIFKDQYIR